MTTFEYMQAIPNASFSVLDLYEKAIKADHSLPSSVRLMLEGKVAKRRASLALLKLFHKQIEEATSGLPILSRIDQAKDEGSITESDHLLLIHTWKMKNEKLRLDTDL